MGRVTVPSRPDKIRVAEGDWEDAYSDYRCDVCGCRYDEHVTVPGYTWLRRICDGTLVKLGKG